MSIKLEDDDQDFEWAPPEIKNEIMIWKLFQELKELISNDYDSFREEVNDNEDLMKLLMHEDYRSIYDFKEQKLKYGLEHSSIWKRMKKEANDKFYDWFGDYQQWSDDQIRYLKSRYTEDLQLIHKKGETDFDDRDYIENPNWK